MSGQVAIVTGGGTGLGRAMAIDMAAEGAAVVVAGRATDPLAETVSLITGADGRAVAVPADVSAEADVIAMVRAAVGTFGRLDVLVNNAGVEFAKSVVDTGADEWDWLMSVNLKGVFLCSKHAIPAMRDTAGGGAIVNIASELALTGSENVAAYSASKGGVVQLTRAMAVDHAPDGIRVNCLCPGVIMTDLLQTALDATGDANRRRVEFEQRTLLKRLGTPQEAAAATTFLASSQSSYMTGGILVLDGGWTAH